MNTKKIYLYILFAYIFSIAFHLFWLTFAYKNPEFLWHGQVMINNPDGYYFASDAQKILYNMHKYNPRLMNPYSYGMGLGVISAYIVKFLPFFSLDTVILYLSAVISSLIVIPIILIGKIYKNLEWGFLSALLASIGWSFYNRTLIGYYDTDMFSVLNITIVLYFFLDSIKNKNILSSFLAFLMILFNEWVYPQGNTIVFAMYILALIYLFIIDREFLYKFVTIVAVGFVGINIFIKFIIGIGLYYLIVKNKIKNEKIVAWIVFIISLVFSKVVMHMIGEVIGYSTHQVKENGLHFLNTNRTVREASHIPYNIIADRIVGSILGIIAAFIGYILLIKKYKEFIIALPLWVVGLFAFIGGLRFTVHAVVIASLSAVYLFVYLSEKYENKLKKYAIILGGTLFLIAPNITHIVGCCENNKTLASFEKIYPLRSYPYLVPTVLNKNEVEILEKLNHISNEKDYAITWWDYGYPIWYYADVNTLIDGGKHEADNFLVSEILTTSNQRLAYNLGKLSIKTYIDNNYTKPAALTLFIKNKKAIGINEFLDKISDENFKSVKLDRNLYLVLPYRMFNIFPTISLFSNRNLNTGVVYPPHFFYKAPIYQKGTILYIGKIPFDLRKGVILIRNGIPVKEVDIVGYDKHMKLHIKKDVLRTNGLYVIILQSYGEALILDKYYYNSTFVQMFVFQNYDKKLFKPVILSPFIKIYKFK